MEQMNFSARGELNTGSADTSRLSAPLRLGMFYRILLLLVLLGCGFWPFRPILRPALLAVRHTGGIERSAHHVIADAGKILHTAPADEHDRVLLQIVPDARDVCRH